MRLPHVSLILPSWTTGRIAVIGLISLLTSAWALSLIIDSQQRQHVTQQSTQLAQSYTRTLADTHQQTLHEQALTAEKLQLQREFDAFKSDPSKQRQAQVEALFAQYAELQTKLARNTGAKLDTSSIANQYASWGQQLLGQQLDTLAASLTKAQTDLDQQYQTYQASLITPTPKLVAQAPATSDGFTRTSVTTSRGTFSVSLIKLKLSEVTVKTVTANTTDCTNNCPTKSLSQYVAENGGYAGMNGTYFCPPDYASCQGKVASYDFAVYNTNLGTWLNGSAATWDSVGLATFNGHSAQFYRYGHDYHGAPVTAAISNFPPLLVYNGQVVTSSSEQDAYMQNKGTKGALGVDGTYIYLALATNANVTDMAYIMQALGARDVLNMDGGGSSAMYINGSYMVGPGRLLPNAVVLVRN